MHERALRVAIAGIAVGVVGGIATLLVSLVFAWFGHDGSIEHSAAGALSSVVFFLLIGAYLGVVAGLGLGLLMALEYALFARDREPARVAALMWRTTVAIVVGIDLYVLWRYIAGDNSTADLFVEAIVPSVVAVAVAVAGISIITRRFVARRPLV